MNKFYTHESDIPNPKDENEYRAGGFFQNETKPGGQLYSPTASPDPERINYNDFAYSLNNGHMYNSLNSGIGTINNLINGYGFLDLMNSYKSKTTIMYKVTLTITDKYGNETNSFTSYKSKGEANSEYRNFKTPGANKNQSIEDIAKMFSQTGVNLTSPDLLNSLMSYSFENMANGEEYESPKIAVSSFVSSSLKNTIISTFSNEITTGLVSVLNVTTFGAMALISVVTTTLLNEAFDVMVGLDNNFGFGGDYAGTGKDDIVNYRENIDFWKGALDTLKEIATLGFIDTNTYNATEFKTTYPNGYNKGWSVDGSLGDNYYDAWSNNIEANSENFEDMFGLAPEYYEHEDLNVEYEKEKEEKDWYSDSVSASQNRHDESLKKYFGIDRDNNNDRDNDNDGPTNDRGEHSSTNSDGSDVEDLDDDEDDEME